MIKFKKINIMLIDKKVNVLLFCILSIISIICLNESFSEAMEFDRGKIENGEFWRILTSSFVHFNKYHAVLNLIFFATIMFMVNSLSNIQYWILYILISSFVIGMSLYLICDEIYIYRGFSGVNYSFIMFATFVSIKNNMKYLSVIQLIVFIKIMQEQFFYSNSKIESIIGSSIAVDAHLFGFLFGCLTIMAYVLRKKTSC